MMNENSRFELIACPGCGGRNEPGARECEWCGRLFVQEHRQIETRWLAPAALGGGVVLMLSVIAFALVGSRSASRPPAPQVTPQVISLNEVDEPEIPTRPATPRPTLTPTASIEIETRPDFVRIANTGGAGAFIRREARAGSPGIVAYRDGIVLKVIGPDVTAEGRSWRQVEDRQGNRGWTPVEYLEDSPTGF